MYHNSRSRQLMNIDKVSACRTFLSRLRRHAEGTTGILWSIGYMYPNVEHVQLLDTCRKRSIFDFGYRRHVERSVHTGATCRILHVECLHVATVWTSYKTSDRQTWRRIRTRQDKAKRRRKIHQYRGISCYGMLCFTIARSTSPARRDGVCRSELYWVRTVDHTHGIRAGRAASASSSSSSSAAAAAAATDARVSRRKRRLCAVLRSVFDEERCDTAGAV